MPFLSIFYAYSFCKEINYKFYVTGTHQISKYCLSDPPVRIAHFQSISSYIIVILDSDDDVDILMHQACLLLPPLPHFLFPSLPSSPPLPSLPPLSPFPVKLLITSFYRWRNGGWDTIIFSPKIALWTVFLFFIINFYLQVFSQLFCKFLKK